MSAPILNRVVLLGNLTRDPELRALPSGASVCRLRLACNSLRRNAETGELDEKANYFDVSVFGPSGEACATFLEKGRQVVVDGRLDWHDWETAEGQRRQAVDIIADSVQFLGAPRAAEQPSAEPAGDQNSEEALAF